MIRPITIGMLLASIVLAFALTACTTAPRAVSATVPTPPPAYNGSCHVLRGGIWMPC